MGEHSDAFTRVNTLAFFAPAPSPCPVTSRGTQAWVSRTRTQTYTTAVVKSATPPRERLAFWDENNFPSGCAHTAGGSLTLSVQSAHRLLPGSFWHALSWLWSFFSRRSAFLLAELLLISAPLSPSFWVPPPSSRTIEFLPRKFPSRLWLKPSLSVSGHTEVHEYYRCSSMGLLSSPLRSQRAPAG